MAPIQCHRLSSSQRQNPGATVHFNTVSLTVTWPQKPGRIAARAAARAAPAEGRKRDFSVLRFVRHTDRRRVTGRWALASVDRGPARSPGRGWRPLGCPPGASTMAWPPIGTSHHHQSDQLRPRRGHRDCKSAPSPPSLAGPGAASPAGPEIRVGSRAPPVGAQWHVGAILSAAQPLPACPPGDRQLGQSGTH